MKRFIIRLLVFSSPILLIFAVAEILARNIPNDYAYKCSYYREHGGDIEYLFLGSSHALYGVDPEFFDPHAFNGAHVSQSLDIDLLILKKYFSGSRRLRLVAIPVSYFSLFSRLDTGPEAWRAKNYQIYYRITSLPGLGQFFEIFSVDPQRLFKRIRKYYLKKDGFDFVLCSDSGFGLGFNSSKKNDLEASAVAAATRHHAETWKDLSENEKTLAEIADFLNDRNILLMLYTPPAHESYVGHLDKEQLEMTVSIPSKLARERDGVIYTNFMSDPSFSRDDFFDADHLNEVGARKFTLILRQSITNLAATSKARNLQCE